MTQTNEIYETVVGLEVHAQLLTRSKLFCGDSASFGGQPNTHSSPITLGHPGTLPVLNEKAIELAIKMGLACHCEIERFNFFARKNYFYPDLPKGYQISQHTSPICKGGYVQISTAEGERKISLNRIHLEEDAGKSLHDQDPENTCIDFNRAGVPLIEIVTEPVIRSGEEAHAFLTELRKLLRYLKVCDGNMEEGSMRCDANVSIRKKGDSRLGTKVEIKNLNSTRNVRRAIEQEARDMMEKAERGDKISQQTKSFDAVSGISFSLRSKEEANDYRYFPDPDLPPFRVSDTFLERIRASIPALPEQLMEKYVRQLKLPEYDARVITDDKEIADYFEDLIAMTSHYKAAANWLLGPVKSYLNEHHQSIAELGLSSSSLSQLIQLVEEGKISFSIASSRIFPVLIQEPDANPEEIASRLNLIQSSDGQQLDQWIREVLARMPDKVAEYKKGKKGLLGLFVGEVKKISKGKADLVLTNQILLDQLEKK
jgi:aspartyl-tRNA(Asn)/glutamyl-tRNA(Gln) amidotransferase subunit B